MEIWRFWLLNYVRWIHYKHLHMRAKLERPSRFLPSGEMLWKRTVFILLAFQQKKKFEKVYKSKITSTKNELLSVRFQECAKVILLNFVLQNYQISFSLHSKSQTLFNCTTPWFTFVWKSNNLLVPLKYNIRTKLFFFCHFPYYWSLA